MTVFALGLNHQSAPLDLRGRFAFTLEQLAPTLQRFTDQLGQGAASTRRASPFSGGSGGHGNGNNLPEAALLSTCNRTELYVAGHPDMVRPAVDWLAGVGGVGSATLLDHAYVAEDGKAARHAFRVASGLDSMVLGEPQILGQLKQAVREADQAGTLGTTLHQLFQRSFSVAKEVRSSTEIGSHSISMAAASVRLAAQLFENLSDIRVLLVGAGEMIELVGTHFSAKGPKGLAVANRTLERGEKLAQHLGAESIRLVDLPQRLHEFDAVISCTASSLPLIGLGAVERALKRRKHRPMFMVDLAVPRDIEPEVAQLDDVYLYTVDDLSQLVQTAGEKRQAAVQQAEAIIEHGVQSFVHWLGQRHTVPLIQALHQQADSWRQAEILRARKLLAKGQDIDTVLEALSKGLTQKMLHGAMAELNSSDGDQRLAMAQTVSRLFLRNTAVDLPAAAASAPTPTRESTRDLSRDSTHES